MIETQADARRLTQIDAATSLGHLADQVVLAVARRLDGATPQATDTDALRAAAAWLETVSDSLERPLNLSHVGVAGLSGFGPYVTDAAIDAISAGQTRDSEVKLLRRLAETTRSIADGSNDVENLERIRNVFEGMASAMLSAAGSLLDAPDKSVWLKTYVS